MTAEATTEDAFRPELQGLRAVAVTAVVLYHLWPARVSGGFVGVDVFFVISGFLITSHLVREVTSTGSVRVGRFWARRIRRLLPAGLLVLAACAVAVVLVLPATAWAPTARQLGASALYVQNWALALDAVDYLAADDVPTVAQHYWSLSVEEQFYLVWPLLVLGLVALAARRAGGRPGPVAVRRALVVGTALLALASLTWSVVSTSQDQALAYLSTLTRVWEFAAGALAALVAVRTPWPPAARAALGWAGLAAIGASALVYTDASAFPGWIALVPVLGTVAVIAAGAGRGRAAPGTWLSLRPARFVGDVSYSVYLWHWPLIVVAPVVLGRATSWPDEVVLLVLTILLAWGTKVLVEDPARTRPLLAAAPWRAFAFAVAGMLVVVAGSARHHPARSTGARPPRPRPPPRPSPAPRPAPGPARWSPENGCGVGRGRRRAAGGAGGGRAAELAAGVPGLPAVDRPSGGPAVRAGGDRGPGPHGRRWSATRTRRSGSPRSTGSGRSRAGRSSPSPSRPARSRRRCGCCRASRPTTASGRAPPGSTRRRRGAGRGARAQTRCSWRRTRPRTSGARARADAAPSRARPPRCAGFGAAWTGCGRRGSRSRCWRLCPAPPVRTCRAAWRCTPHDRAACAVPRARGPARATSWSRRREALGDPGVRTVDLGDLFCDDATCYPVVGDVVVYRDYSHLSTEYSTLLVPYLLERYEAPAPCRRGRRRRRRRRGRRRTGPARGRGPGTGDGGGQPGGVGDQDVPAVGQRLAPLGLVRSVVHGRSSR